MNKKAINIIAMAAVVASGALVSCNDYNAAAIAYEENLPLKPAPVAPEVDPAWRLEMLTNVGQFDENVFVYKDKLYDELFTRDYGWNGGELVRSIALPDGNIAWLFKNSYFGVVGNNRARLTGNQPLNAVMIQKAHSGKPGTSAEDLVFLNQLVQDTDPVGEGFMMGLTYLRNPSAKAVKPEDIAKGVIDTDYYYAPMDGVVTSDGKLQIMWADFRVRPITHSGTGVTTLSLSGVPGDADYCKIVKQTDKFRTGNNATAYYGDAILCEGGYIYMYTTLAVASTTQLMVARVPENDVEGAWEYYIRDIEGEFRWQTSVPTTAEYQRSALVENNGQCSNPQIIKSGDMYYLVGQMVNGSKTVAIWQSETPVGPFTDKKALFAIPETLDKLGFPLYNQLVRVNVHPQISREGELVFSAITNTSNSGDNYTYEGSADFARPYFWRVYNWQSLFDED